jgi:UDP-N-acetylmuramate--alanine ligase
VPGALNVQNAAVAAAVAAACGIDDGAIAAGLGAFHGAPRRFERRGTLQGTTIVEDYAHLPDEVAATVAAARASGFARIGAVFQPHRITRTEAIGASFAGAFAGVESLVVTDVYASGEANPRQVTGALVADAVRDGRDAPTVRYVTTLEEAAAAVEPWLGSIDLLLVLGAGDVGRVAELLLGSERP